MPVLARVLFCTLLLGSAAMAGQPVMEETPCPCPFHWPPHFLQVIIDTVRCCLPRESAPYLQVTTVKPIQLAGADVTLRQPPRLPTIHFVEPKPPTPPTPPVDPNLPPPDAAPAAPAPTPEEEAVKFFQRDPNAPTNGDQRNLGPAFDPTFQPAPPPSPVGSSATYHLVP